MRCREGDLLGTRSKVVMQILSSSMRAARYPLGSPQDREMLSRLGLEKLLDLFFLHVRNLWRVDGLYFLGIEERFGTDAATEIDTAVWEAMAELEAKSLMRLFGIEGKVDVATVVDLLLKTSWALDQPFKTVEVGEGWATLSVDRCRTQEARLMKGLGEFPCKKVRFGYLKKFVAALNPDIDVRCVVCPPDEHPEDLWCEWEFRVKR